MDKKPDVDMTEPDQGGGARTTESGAHPESYCHKCMGPNITWFAPSELWNKYAGDHDILCPICFVKLAEAAGFDSSAWCVAPETFAVTPTSLRKDWGLVEAQLRDLIAYIDRFYDSGNSIPIERPWIGADTWKVAKELIVHGLPLEHDLIERECVYRRKKATYGDETRAKSPLQERLATLKFDGTAQER